jgi:FlgD Ig-like domain
VMFGSRLSGPQVPFMRSIWTNRSGQIALVVRGTLPLPGSAAGDPAPGLPPGFTFSQLVIADFNAPGQIAFTGVVTFNMNFDDQTEGIWWENPGGHPGPLSLLAHEGDQVPGLDPGVVYDGLNRFLSFGDNGQAAFLAFLRGTGGNGSNNTSLFLTDLAGETQLVLRTGSLFEVGSERDQRTIAVLLPGHLNAAGELPMEIGFTDGSTGLFVARITDVTAVVEPDTKVPPAVEPVRLDPLFPNPMVGAVTIPFALGAPSPVELRIHDVAGRTVVRLLDEPRGGGQHALRWDGRDELGRLVANGVYFVELSVGGSRMQERVIVDR